MTKQGVKKPVVPTRSWYPNSGWALSFSLFGLIGFLAALWVAVEYNPDNLEARIETKDDGAEVVHWFIKGKQPILIALLPTPIPSELPTPIYQPQVDSTFQQADLEEKYDIAVKAVNSGEYQKAQNYLQAYLKIDPSRQVAYYLLGYVQRRIGEINLARESYWTFLGLNPTSKFKFSAAAELVYLMSQKNNGCIESVKKLKGILFDQRGEAFAIDKKTGDITRTAWQSALTCSVIEMRRNSPSLADKYNTWLNYLSKLSDDDYKGDACFNRFAYLNKQLTIQQKIYLVLFPHFPSGDESQRLLAFSCKRQWKKNKLIISYWIYFLLLSNHPKGVLLKIYLTFLIDLQVFLKLRILV